MPDDASPPSLSRAEQRLAEKTVTVLLLQGKNPQGEPIYAYVAVRLDMLETFMRAQTQPGFNPEQYGVILASGTGEPDAQTRAHMETEYGFNHEGMVFLSADGSSPPSA